MTRFPEYDIIMLALPRWDAPYSSASFSLAKALSHATRVFYIDNPVSLKEYVRDRNTPAMKRRREALFLGGDFFTMPDPEHPNLFAITPSVTLPVNWLPDGKLYDIASAMNDFMLTRSLDHLLHVFAIRRYILINSFNPLFGRKMPLRVRPVLTVYHCVDDIQQTPYLRKHGVRLESEWIRNADFTVVTSNELKRKKSTMSPQVHLLPNAANAKLFRSALKENLAVPEEMARITGHKKVICYLGNICQRLDYELLKKIAAVHTDKVLLLIGPRTRRDHGASALQNLPNVVFVPPKKPEALPAYLQYSHCCIIPFLCNELTKSIYPLKINEYLSAGKAVITTNFSEDIWKFREVAWIGQNHDEFIDLIDKAIDNDNEDAKMPRVMAAAANTWEARAHHFIELTVEFLKQHDRRTGNSKRRERTQALYG